MAGTSEEVVFDVLTDEYDRDPHPVLRQLRDEHGWHVHTPFGGMVLGYRQCAELARDQRLLSYGTLLMEVQGVTEGPLWEWWRRAPLHLDGEPHSRQRKLIVKAFTPRSIEALAPRIEAIVDDLVAAIPVGEPFDFMDTFADPLPARVMAELLGIPSADLPRFTEWARSLGLAFGMDVASHRTRIEDAVVGLYDYTDALIAERRTNPGDDLVSRLVEIEAAGERLAADELQALVVALIFAGHDTTRNQLGCAMHAFASHPAEWRRLAADPTLAPAATEEVLRYEPGVGGTARRAREAFTYEGLDVAEGALLSLSALAGNRDPDVFDDPDRFDVGRVGEPPLTFGGGVHHCVGAWLARAEVTEVLRDLPARFPHGPEPAGPVEWRPRSGIRGPLGLPVRFAG